MSVHTDAAEKPNSMSASVGRCVFWVAFALLSTGLLSATLLADRWLPGMIADKHPTEEVAPPAIEEEPAVGQLASLPKAAGRTTVLPQGTGQGWPTLLGPRLDGTSTETGLNLEWPKAGPFEMWRFPVGVGYSSPVVLGDALVLLHRKADREIVECFDPETGQSRWEHSWPAEYECPFAHSSGPYSAPALEGDRIYAIGAAGETWCLRSDDGEVVWHRSLHDDYGVKIEVWPAAASPLIDEDRLILNLGGREAGAGVIALDKVTGETLWTATSDGASCSTPRAATIHGRRHVLVWTADALVSIDPADGTVRWRIPFAANNREAAHGTTPLVADDIVLVSGFQLGNLCVRVLPDGSYQELWRDKRQLLDTQYGNLLYLDGCVCGFSCSRKSLRCLDLLTGELRWQWRSRKIRTGTMIALNGGCLVLAENGRLASLTLGPDGVTERSITERPVLSAPAMSYPALHNGLLYLRNEKEMVCIDLRRGSTP